MKTPSLADPLPVLRAVADPSRLRILRLLDRGELAVGELAQAAGLPQSGASRHVAALREAGLVEERAEGVRTYLRLAAPPDGAAAVVGAVLEHVRSKAFGHGDDLERLDEVLRLRENGRGDVFDSLAADWDALRARLLGGALGGPEIASLLASDGLRVVDAGTGTGVHLPWLSAVVGPEGRVIAVERSPEMARRARTRAAELPNVEVRRGRIEDLPVEAHWADALVLSLSLGQTADPSAALAACVRAVRPGGRVVVADVEAHGDRTLVERLGRGFAGFPPETLLALLREAGLERVRRIELPAVPAAPSRGPGRTGAPSVTIRSVPRLTPLLVAGSVPSPARPSRRNR